MSGALDPIAAAGGHTSLSGARPCPFLGSVEGRDMPFDQPSRRNACYAVKGRKRKGLRSVPVRFVAVHRAHQAEYCFGDFSRCAQYHKAQENSETPERAEDSSRPRKRPPRAAGKPDPAAPGKKRRRKEPSQSRLSLFLRSKRVRKSALVGAATSICFLLAFGLYALIAAEPSRWVEFVFNTIVMNDIKSFGIRQAGIKDKSKVSGIAGGNLRAMKGLSKAKLKSLKKSGLGKKLTKAQKAKLRKQFRRFKR